MYAQVDTFCGDRSSYRLPIDCLTLPIRDQGHCKRRSGKQMPVGVMRDVLILREKKRHGE